VADAIAGALVKPDRLASMARAARQVGMARDWDRLAEEMETIYGRARTQSAALATLEGA
jgi:hypothetical protein